MNNRNYQIINKILKEIEVIENLIAGFDIARFSSDERTKRAVCMTIINIPWKAIAGMRDITAHKYQTLKMGDVWVTIQKDIPKLKIQLNDILKNVT